MCLQLAVQANLHDHATLSQLNVGKDVRLKLSEIFLRKGRVMDWLNAIQWPAMVVTVIAAWLVASQRKFKRNWGFWLFLLSNLLWIAWGLHDRAYALIFLQLCLAFLNIRGTKKNRTDDATRS
jgi:hypothetical protein